MNETPPARTGRFGMIFVVVVVAGSAVGVLGWHLIANRNAASVNTEGFDLDKAPEAARPVAVSPASRPAPAPQSSLGSFKADADIQAVGGSPRGPASGTTPGASGESPGSFSPTSSAKPEAPASAPAQDPDPRELAKAGLPTDAKGLAGLGARQGMLSSVVGKFLKHPSVLKAVFNNKLVVDAFMSRDVSKRNCSDAGALKSYLSDPKSAGMTKVFPVLQTVLSHPAAAASLADTEMAQRVMDCPSVQTLSSDKTAVMSVAAANPQAMMLLTDPRLTQALTSNPQAASLLGGLTSSMGGGALQR